MEKIYRKVGRRYIEIPPKTEMELDEELVLVGAFRYALGRRTYIVNSICNELIRLESILSDDFKEKTMKEIIEYQENYGSAGGNTDNAEWNYIKWLFDPERRYIVEAFDGEIWTKQEAVKGEDGLYYTLNGKNHTYHTTRNGIKKKED